MTGTKAVLHLCRQGLAGFAVLYLLLLGIYMELPYLRPGDYLVAELKHRLARSGNAFQETGRPLHVMAFGWSKTLAGFIPAQFDAEMEANGIPHVQSYNFGIAGDKRFVDDLESMAAHGTAPDLALLTFPWPSDQTVGVDVFHFIPDDQEVINKLFPFRHLIRDTFVLFAEGHGLRGMLGLYQNNKASVTQVAANRGYYFMASQSHFANDRLPEDFHMPTDTPEDLWHDPQRTVTLGPAYQHLAPILAAHKITCLLVPLYFRKGEFAPPPASNASLAKLLERAPNVSVAGPDYFLYPVSYFSDAFHVNRVGAAAYTKDLSRIVANWMMRHK